MAERRAWTKFGDTVKGDDADSCLTIFSTEEVLLERRYRLFCSTVPHVFLPT
jgi:hypothetical protein